MSERFISLPTDNGILEWTHARAHERLTPKFRLVHGGSLKPRLDAGSKGTPTYHMDKREAEKKETEITKKATLRRAMAKAEIREALLETTADELPPIVLPTERVVEIDRDSKVVPLFIRPGLPAWQSL